MRAGTCILQWLEVPSKSGLGQVRAPGKKAEASARHPAACWSTTMFVLGVACLACRNPDREPHPVDPVIRPRLTKAIEGVSGPQAPVGTLANRPLPGPVNPAADGDPKAARVEQPPTAPMDKSQQDPSTLGPAEGGALTAIPSMRVAVGPQGAVAVGPTTGSPADPAASALVAKGGEDQNASVTTAGLAVVVPTTPTQAIQATEGHAVERAPSEPPMDPAPQVHAAKRARDWSGPVATDGKVVSQVPPVQGSQATRGPEGVSAISLNPADQAALAQVARTDKDWRVRLAAVGGLNLQSVLAEIALADEDVDVRKLAVNRLTIQAALARVATRDKDWGVRQTAVAMLTDQGVLANIALLDEDSDIRRLAVGRLTGQADLVRVARGDKDWSVRTSAVTKLTSRAVLAQIATRDPDRDVRQLAVGKLKYPAATP